MRKISEQERKQILLISKHLAMLYGMKPGETRENEEGVNNPDAKTVDFWVDFLSVFSATDIERMTRMYLISKGKW